MKFRKREAQIQETPEGRGYRGRKEREKGKERKEGRRKGKGKGRGEEKQGKEGRNEGKGRGRKSKGKKEGRRREGKGNYRLISKIKPYVKNMPPEGRQKNHNGEWDFSCLIEIQENFRRSRIQEGKFV